jgi:hypothetical protein
MKVIVKHSDVQTDVTTKGNTIHRQRAALDLGDGYPLPFYVPLRSAELAYAPGEYQLAPECFRVSQYGSLEIDRYNVRLLTPAVKKAA